MSNDKVGMGWSYKSWWRGEDLNNTWDLKSADMSLPFFKLYLDF